jgi:hypothetical protein
VVSALYIEEDGKMQLRVRVLSMSEEELKRQAEITDAICREALELGIDLPGPRDKPEWWFDDTEQYSGPLELAEYMIRNYLTDDGKIGARGLINERQAVVRDRKIRWICQIIAAVTGLLGSIIGILAIILSMMRK